MTYIRSIKQMFIFSASGTQYKSTMESQKVVQECLSSADFVNKLQVERGYTIMLVSSNYTNDVAKANMLQAR